MLFFVLCVCHIWKGIMINDGATKTAASFWAGFIGCVPEYTSALSFLKLILISVVYFLNPHFRIIPDIKTR